MKYVVCIPDGCADEPVKELGGKTPLEAAETPVLRELAARATIGRAQVIPEGLPPGSDVGNMSILGYNPADYHTGRAPIEAAAMGLRLAPDQIAYRCNLITTSEDGSEILDFAGGHPDSETAAKVINALNDSLSAKNDQNKQDIRFHCGVQYRHIMVSPAEWADTVCVPPHDLTGKPAIPPKGPESEKLIQLMQDSREVMAEFSDIEANQIWLWGQGFQPQLPQFQETYKQKAGMVTAVDLVRGLGVLTGMDVVEVPGATAWYDTNYEGKRDAVLQGLENGADLFVLHIEASDEAGHAGNVEEKVKSLENWDSRVLQGLVDGLDKMGDWRLMLLPDHATPLHLKTHTPDAVPYMIVDSRHPAQGGVYSEDFVKDMPAKAGHELMPELLKA